MYGRSVSALRRVMRVALGLGNLGDPYPGSYALPKGVFWGGDVIAILPDLGVGFTHPSLEVDTGAPFETQSTSQKSALCIYFKLFLGPFRAL